MQFQIKINGFSYYWWFDPVKAPSFAKRWIFIENPVMILWNYSLIPNTKSIPLDGKLVRGSHGRLPSQGESPNPVYVSNIKNISGTKDGNNLSIVTVGQYLKTLL